MTVTIPAMALAAMVGSGCPVNQANMNQYNQAMNPGSNPSYIQVQNGGADLSALLRQMGASCPAGLCDGLNSNCPSGSCGANDSCGIHGNSCFTSNSQGCGNQNFGGFNR